MRRGDIRHALLIGLLDGPAHGYEIIRRLEERSGGMWRPSAGSVYPTLQLLDEQGLLRSHEDGGKRVYELTDEGRAEAETGSGHMPWDGPGAEVAGRYALRAAMGQLEMAARQVTMAADEAGIAAATGIVTEARQKLYRLLADS